MSGTTSTATVRETDLYEPVKRLLEGQGYEVKGEIGAVDVMAVRDDEPPVIVELKTGFSLSLFHQAVARQRVSDVVYVAVPRGTGKAFGRSLRNNLGLCRRLGLGLITVRLRDGFVQVHCDPAPYRPRPATAQRARLLKEFAKRVGDPNTGGTVRQGLITAYRQDALRCVKYLKAEGQSKASEVAAATGVKTARRIMADDHYGWFDRVARGIYTLTPKGAAAARSYAAELSDLTPATDPP